MNTYCAQSCEDGVMFDHTYQAESDEQAIKIAEARGWEVIGDLVCEQIVYADEESDILDYVTPEKMH